MSDTRIFLPPTAFKPDFQQSADRWDAYFSGEMIDRPVLIAQTRKRGSENLSLPGHSYRASAFADIDRVLDDALVVAEHTYFGGDAMPAFYPSIGPDEIAAYCGATLNWLDEDSGTNWSEPFITDWEKQLPIRIDEQGIWWQRILAVYSRAAERLQGKMLLYNLDMHTNLDLLASIRGAENLCVDMMIDPELIDLAMVSAREVFRKLWKDITTAGCMDRDGYWFGGWAKEGMCVLASDFSALIGPDHFRRWGIPALEEEASIVGKVIYHWDGPGALAHTDALLETQGLHTMAYVPLPDQGLHNHFLELMKRCQAAGKGVAVVGTPDECKIMHKELKPEKTLYNVIVKTQDEAEAIDEWFKRNT